MTRRAAGVAVAVCVLVAAFGFALPRISDYGDAWQRITRMPRPNVAALVAVSLWNLATYWFVLVAALPGLTVWQACLSSLSSTAVSNTVPAGGAWGAGITWTMYRRWGFGREEIARALAVSGAWNTLVKLATPPLAVVVVAVVGGDGHLPVAIGVVSATTLVAVTAGVGLAVRRPAAAHRVGAWAERWWARVARRRPQGAPWGEGTERIRAATATLVADRWPLLSITALVSHASLFLVLWTALRATGVPTDDVTLAETLLAFAVVRAALVLPVTPGGAGLAEVGLAGLLVAAGGNGPDVVAGVLVFRAVTWLLPVPAGGVAYLVWLASSRPARRDAVAAR